MCSLEQRGASSFCYFHCVQRLYLISVQTTNRYTFLFIIIISSPSLNAYTYTADMIFAASCVNSVTDVDVIVPLLWRHRWHESYIDPTAERNGRDAPDTTPGVERGRVTTITTARRCWTLACCWSINNSSSLFDYLAFLPLAHHFFRLRTWKNSSTNSGRWAASWPASTPAWASTKCPAAAPRSTTMVSRGRRPF